MDDTVCKWHAKAVPDAGTSVHLYLLYIKHTSVIDTPGISLDHAFLSSDCTSLLIAVVYFAGVHCCVTSKGASVGNHKRKKNTV